MDPRITPELIHGGNILFRTLSKAVKATIALFLPKDFKFILVLVLESKDLPGLAIMTDLDERADMVTHLEGALQRITNPTEDLIDSSDPRG